MKITCKKEFWICAGAMAAVIIYYAFVGSKPAHDGIKLGGAFGLSGNCAEWGEGERMAVQMAVDEINTAGGIHGTPIDFVIEDTQCENKTTVNAVIKLVHADAVQAVIGPTWGDAYQSASAIFNESKVPGVSPDTAMEALELQKQPIDYVFSTYAPQRKEISALQAYSETVGIKKIAMVWDQDSYSTMMTRLFKEAAPAHGIALTDEHEMPTGIQDFRTIIAKIKNMNPDAVFISFLAPHTKASFLKQAKELGLRGVILSAADIQDDSVLKSFGALMDGVIYTYPLANDGQKAFRAAYQVKYKKDPQGPAAVNAYDAVYIVAEAMKGGAVTGTAIRDALLHAHIKGAFIPDVRFDDKHQVGGGAFEVKTVRNGTFIPLK
jgi:branched-chain amino acid transport system substrate-binding protein